MPETSTFYFVLIVPFSVIWSGCYVKQELASVFTALAVAHNGTNIGQSSEPLNAASE